MTQAHIDQLHEAAGSIPNMRFGSTGNNGGGGGHGDGGPPGLGYRNTDGNAGGLGRAPVPAATGGPSPPNPPDDDDDGNEGDEEEPSDDDDDRRRNRRSSRRRRSRDRRDHDSGQPRISRKEAEKVNVPPWPKVAKLDSWETALTMNVASASDPDIEVWMSRVACAFVVNPDLEFLADSGGERFAMMDILTPPAQAADITGLLSYLRPFGIVPLPPSPLRFLPPFLC